MKSVRHVATLSHKPVREVLLDELEPYYHNDKHWDQVKRFRAEAFAAEHVDTVVAARFKGRSKQMDADAG